MFLTYDRVSRNPAYRGASKDMPMLEKTEKLRANSVLFCERDQLHNQNELIAHLAVDFRDSDFHDNINFAAVQKSECDVFARQVDLELILGCSLQPIILSHFLNLKILLFYRNLTFYSVANLENKRRRILLACKCRSTKGFITLKQIHVCTGSHDAARI